MITDESMEKYRQSLRDPLNTTPAGQLAKKQDKLKDLKTEVGVRRMQIQMSAAFKKAQEDGSLAAARKQHERDFVNEMFKSDTQRLQEVDSKIEDLEKYLRENPKP